MRRRAFIKLLAATTAVWPLPAPAQQAGRIRRIGILMGGESSNAQNKDGIAALMMALGDLGWIEGINMAVDVRWAEADVQRMTSLAKELVGLKPDLLIGHTTQ